MDRIGYHVRDNVSMISKKIVIKNYECRINLKKKTSMRWTLVFVAALEKKDGCLSPSNSRVAADAANAISIRTQTYIIIQLLSKFFSSENLTRNIEWHAESLEFELLLTLIDWISSFFIKKCTFSVFILERMSSWNEYLN